LKIEWENIIYAYYLSLEIFQYNIAVQEYTKHTISSNIDAMNVNSLAGKLMCLNTDRSYSYYTVFGTAQTVCFRWDMPAGVNKSQVYIYIYIYIPFIQKSDDASQLEPKHVDRNWCCVWL